MKLLLLLLPALLAAHEIIQQCEETECMSREDLLKVVKRYEKEQRALMYSYVSSKSSPSISKNARSGRFFDMQGVAGTTGFGTTASAPTCNICSSAPCLNGGTCLVDSQDPWTKYTCECPDNYTDDHCQTKVECLPNSCGSNATCAVNNHQIVCTCNMGFSGDPYKGCGARVRVACASGDPHYTTFDGLNLNYMSTCPLVYSMPCTGLSGGYDNFQVNHKNELTYAGSPVSVISEVDVIMYGQHIHFDRMKSTMYFNKVRVGYPFYWPTQANPNITLDFVSGMFSATSNQLVTVTFTTGAQICLYVPDVPEFHGQNTLCGLAGNIDDNKWNDVVYRNGTVFPVTSSPQPDATDAVAFNHAEDTWIIQDFFYTSGSNICATGETMANNTNCDLTPAITACAPILDSMNGDGPFSMCIGMGNATIQNLYDNCVYDVCHSNNYKCSALSNFVTTCQTQLPNTNPGPWRDTTNCPRTCSPNSIYSPCTSSCPGTCADSDPATCNKGCMDGCQCLPGYVQDNSNTQGTNCIRIEDCGCSDPNGNQHSADNHWLDNNCTISATCSNGTYLAQPTSCSIYGACGTDANHNMACVCDPGFTGDGFNCTDIDECLDPNSCGQGQGLGKCTNTLGSYNCTCNPYQTGRDCQNYQPTRHCADLLVYWNVTTDGVYSINLPEGVTGRAAYSSIPVYCDMNTNGGGWTLLSHADGNQMANKSYAAYQYGFGDPSTKNLFLGLDIINKMSTEVATSLMVVITRCPIRNNPPLVTDCTYPSWSINGPASNYSVVIPQTCEGTETDQFPYNDDGWKRWTGAQGPDFYAFDSQQPGSICSETYLNTGFWYDLNSRCGYANLDGARYDCANPPPEGTASYIHWSGQAIADASMYLRPAGFPKYN